MMSDVRLSSVNSDEKKTAINAGENTSCKQQNCQYQGRPDYKITYDLIFFLYQSLNHTCQIDQDGSGTIACLSQPLKHNTDAALHDLDTK
jgi:hypothetical protein